MSSKSRNRARDFAALIESAPQELDPENDAGLSEDGSEEDENDISSKQTAARAHYDKVAKSKLRKPKDVSLGPQYRGSKVSRDEMMESDDDDPFAQELDEEESGDEEIGTANLDDGAEEDDDTEEDDEEEDDEEPDLEDDEDDEMASDGEETEDTELSYEDGEVDEESADDFKPHVIDKSELRKAMASEQSAISATILAANKADAEKGRAVKHQQSAFDSLLSLRIKLQKSLIASNSLVALQETELQSLRNEGEEVIEKAESAAFNLWSSLTKLREEITEARTGQKRRFPGYSQATSAEELWSFVETQETGALPYRDATLAKWSIKSRGPSATPTTGKLNNSRPTTIVDVLREQLSNTERSLKRARTPRSCAPVQLANRVTEDKNIYDDADFYGLLLKELLEAKSASTTTTAVNVDLSSLAKLRKDTKTKKNVDTRASKGRKLKYNVHEKLQNFCAPDDRTTWGEQQTDDLFSSLFGQKAGLNEDQVDGGDEEEEEAGDDVMRLMFQRG